MDGPNLRAAEVGARLGPSRSQAEREDREHPRINDYSSLKFGHLKIS